MNGSTTTQEVTIVFDEVMRKISEKNAGYQDAWREHGWRGSLSKILTKSARLRNMLWRNNVALMNGEAETPRETLIDLIAHAAFCAINMDQGREWGGEDVQHMQYHDIGEWRDPNPPPLFPQHPEMPATMMMQPPHVHIPDVQPGEPPERTQIQESPLSEDPTEKPKPSPTKRRRTN